MTKNVQQFLDANALSPVISGAVIGQGGQGAHYTLENGAVFELSHDDCETIGKPRWLHHV